MARQKTSPLVDLFDFLRTVPWWAGLLTVGLMWALFAWIVPGILEQMSGDDTLSLSMYGTLAGISRSVSPFVTIVVALIWGGAMVRNAVDARRLDEQTGIESIRSMSWQAFEQLLAEAYRRQGYAVRDTGAGADGGIDLILTKDGHDTLVQAKQWKARKVGVPIVRELLGVQVARKAAAAIIITTGRFTSEAEQFARQNGIALIDGEALARLIASVQRTEHTAPSTKPASVTPREARSTPTCPQCGAVMVERVAKRGTRAGEAFWGCSNYPDCRGTRKMVAV